MTTNPFTNLGAGDANALITCSQSISIASSGRSVIGLEKARTGPGCPGPATATFHRKTMSSHLVGLWMLVAVLYWPGTTGVGTLSCATTWPQTILTAYWNSVAQAPCASPPH